MLADEIHNKTLKLIKANPQMNQREVARESVISLGKANYFMKALIEKGTLKVSNFLNRNNKLGYVYKLTLGGMQEKSKIRMRYV